MKTDPQHSPENIDWNLTTWEGTRREQLHRWSELAWERIVAALEEMQKLSEELNNPYLK